MSETSEHNIQNKIRVALSSTGIVFRINSGKFYQGRIRHTKQYGIILTDLKVVVGFPKGSSDLIYIGNNGSVSFIEVKDKKGTVSPEQLNFIKAMNSRGIKSGVARSVEDAKNIIGVQKKKRRLSDSDIQKKIDAVDDMDDNEIDLQEIDLPERGSASWDR